MSTLEIKDLHVSIETEQGTKEILKGVSLTIKTGEIHAIGDTCSHADISLSEGEVEGCMIECWGHGSQFDLRTGEPLQVPAYDPVPVFAVEIRGDEVYVDFTNVVNGAEAPNFS